MLFNSYQFILFFFPVSMFGYVLLNRLRIFKFSIIWLALCSLFFYSWWDIRNLPLMLFSIVFNYFVGFSLTKKKEKLLLVFGVGCNLAFLFYYKYYDFFVTNINSVLSTNIPLIKVVLPLGISFFTFTQIAYLVDAFKGGAKEYNFFNYVLFVTFFPHLIAGPIIHHKEMMPQFSSLRSKVLNWTNISRGLLLFAIGLSKKVIIADTFALWVDPGFQAVSLTMVEAWSAALSYTFQLYFDFSGYTDMALGLGLFFGIKLPQNFDSPYKADSIIDFWRRWHITLSRFLRDYLYIPLGGSRKGQVRRYINLVITMLLGGLWHGASWTFVFWGLLHGVGLAVNHLWRALGLKMITPVSRVFTFIFVVIAWVFFRAPNFEQALVVLKGMVNFNNMGIWINGGNPLLPWGYKGLGIILLTYVVVNIAKNSTDLINDFQPNWKWASFVSFLFVSGLLGLNRVSQFLYFQF